MAYVHGYDNCGASIILHDVTVSPEIIELKEEEKVDDTEDETHDRSEKSWIWMGKEVQVRQMVLFYM